MPPHHRPIKSTTLTLKVTNRRVLARPPTPDLSGDEGYSALEDLGDSGDEDEENVGAAEEEHLLGLARIHTARSPPRPVSDDEDDDVDVEEDVDADGDDEGDEAAEDDDDLMYEEDDDDGEESAGGSWHGFVTDDTETDGDMNPLFPGIHNHFPPSERHVRFANLPDSDSDDTDTDDDHADMFPDIFVDQSTLDPAIRREIDRDPEESSGSNSFWDFHGGFEYSSAESDTDIFLPRSVVTTAPPTDDDATPTATPAPPSHAGANLIAGLSAPIRPLDMQVDLDGYETDGDTTEEDVPEPIVRKKSRRPEPVDDDSDSDCALVVKSNRGKPRVGRFNLDKSDKKPIAVLNPITRKMMIFTPHRHRQLDLSPEQFNFAFFSSVEATSPAMAGGSSTYMLDTMFSSNTFGDFMNGQDMMGDVDAFLQSALMSEANTLDDSLESDLGADEGEKTLDINDFITFTGGASESESEHDAWNAGEGSSAAAAAGAGEPGASDAEMLSHLSSATVGAFRQNQITQQLIFSHKATQDSLAFSGPFNDTALRGMKSDRLATAATPLTPVRRRRKSSVNEPPTSPLASVALKRKAPGGHEGHKRHRSITDMALLHV